jgi:uncharacterized membrane protein (UPF0127 family)
LSRALADETGRIVVERCQTASSMWSRMRGLLGRKGLAPGEGLMITKTGSIHTAFMAFPIDAVFLDRELRVRRVVAEIRPYRLAFGHRGAKQVLELAAGEAARAGITEGLRLQWQDH